MGQFRRLAVIAVGDVDAALGHGGLLETFVLRLTLQDVS